MHFLVFLATIADALASAAQLFCAPHSARDAYSFDIDRSSHCAVGFLSRVINDIYGEMYLVIYDLAYVYVYFGYVSKNIKCDIIIRVGYGF